MIQIIKNRRIPFIISGLLFVTSIALLITKGLTPGIDFTGGSLLEVSFRPDRPSVEQMREVASSFGIEGNVLVQTSGDDGYILKMPFLSEEEHQDVLSMLRDEFEAAPEAMASSSDELATSTMMADTAPTRTLTEKRFETIGPSVSSHLRSRSISAGVAVMVMIIVYVAYAFRKVSAPVESWKYGLTAIIALLHDVVITLGALSILSHLYGLEIDIPIVVALLTILGYSVNDTIVVFDRIRENLIKRGSKQFADTVNVGVNQTILRSINTSITTLAVLVALALFGGYSVKPFALTMIIGIVLGTYSSIFLASPLLVEWEARKKRR